MKKFLLDKINNYIPYLENNYPIFLENSERVVEFNFNFDENVMHFIDHCENLTKKKEIPFIVDSSLNDRFTDSKLIDSNGLNGINENVAISNNNVGVSNNIPSAQLRSNTNSQNVNLTEKTEKTNNNIPTSQKIEEPNETLKQATIASLPKDGPAAVSKNEAALHEEIDINGIPIRKDFSDEESSNSLLNTSDKIFLETIYTKKKSKKDFTTKDFNIIDGMMLNDSDLEQFLCALEKNEYFIGKLLAVDQNLSDETCIKLASILKRNSPKITVLDLSKNSKLDKLTGIYIGEALKANKTIVSLYFHNVNLTPNGANRLIESIRENSTLKDIDFGNLTDSSLKVLTKFLSGEHHLTNMAFGEDISEPWREETKNQFVLALRQNTFNRFLLSICVYCEDVWTHYNLLGNVSLFAQKNRENFLKEENQVYKMRALEYHQPEYFEEDNHLENKFKFSCKNYISNVFATVLDEGLYYLEKERMNMLRDAEISNVKKEEEVKDKFLEDICTSDGSILFLCQFLLTKLDK